MLAIAWRHSGASPYAMFNGLDSTLRPWGHPEFDPAPPAYPSRVKSFTYACAVYAEEMDLERLKLMSGASVARRVGG